MAAIVRLVTLVDKNAPTVKAFGDELTALFGNGHKTLDYKAYSAVAEGSPSAAAIKAVNDNPQVIVAGGTAAVVAVIAAENAATPPSTAPIVMVGGAAPPSPPPRLTGFLINQLTIAQAHVTALLAVATKIAVLYDNTAGSLSLDTFTKITTAGATPYIPAGQLVSCPASTDTQIQNSNLGGADGFMLIPNATYYEYYKDVVKLVDGQVTWIYYPEREYKRWHLNTNGVHVHGHSIPLAFRQAAWYADSITSGDWVVGGASFPKLMDALTDDT
jgi:hypothetical protein